MKITIGEKYNICKHITSSANGKEIKVKEYDTVEVIALENNKVVYKRSQQYAQKCDVPALIDASSIPEFEEEVKLSEK